jgi:hypothetical protein
VIKLFDDFSRTYLTPGGYNESSFDYLNRSASEPICKIRRVLEDWFSRYPADHQLELSRRFRARDEFDSAFFELWLHELMLRLGCEVEVHPTLPRTNRKVDFFVKSPQDKDFYLEAIHVSGASREESKSQARLNSFYDSLNYLNSPNFFINLDVSGTPSTSVPGKEFKAFLERELSRLNPELIDHFLETRRFDLLPQWRFEHEGLRITCYPTPKPTELRGVSGVRTLATKTFGGVIDSESPIKNAVISKAKRYGRLDLPLVVAVNTTDPFISDRDVLNALYGSIRGWNDAEIMNDSRGVWGSVDNPKWTRVSGVLATFKLRSDKLVVPVCLYHNPRPAKPYGGELTRLPQLKPINNRLVTQDGESLEGILGLPSDFPEDA